MEMMKKRGLLLGALAFVLLAHTPTVWAPRGQNRAHRPRQRGPM
jgi:hypothetical protein